MSELNQTIPQRFRAVIQQNPDMPIVYEKDDNDEFQPIRCREFYREVQAIGTSLLDMGAERGSTIGIIADNRREWLVFDLAITGIGAVDVPRGTDSTGEEICYILGHSECSIVVVENPQMAELVLSFIGELPSIKTLIVIDFDAESSIAPVKGCKIVGYDELLERGHARLNDNDSSFEEALALGRGEERATILYTSGTTAAPKGVILSHQNFIFQLDRIGDHVGLSTGHILMSILPIWHSFERSVTYLAICKGVAIGYSSPVGSIMINDFKKLNPHWITSVPRIWDGIRSAVYRKIKKSSKFRYGMFLFAVFIGKLHSRLLDMLTGKTPRFDNRPVALDIIVATLPMVILSPFRALMDVLVFRKLRTLLGSRFLAGISGGGHLPTEVDRFFQAARITVLEGYGLTEAAPVLSVRKHSAPIIGTVGPLLRDIEYRVESPNGEALPPGKKGVLFVKSGQIMEGYLKQPELTEQVLKDGWLNTGDLVVFTRSGEFFIVGREKETIVLTGGENVEPVPIEEKLAESEYIDQVMVVGQDRKFISALIVPNMDLIKEFAADESISYIDDTSLVQAPHVVELIWREIRLLVGAKTGFKPFERIAQMHLLTEPFQIGRELTKTLKLRRKVIEELYSREIATLFR